MVKTLVAYIALLLLTAGAMSCTRSPNVDTGRQTERIGNSIAVGDTGFVEEHRYEEPGVRMPNGTCRYVRPGSPPPGSVAGGVSAPIGRVPAGDTAKRWGQRRVWRDAKRCVTVVVVGYTRTAPSDVALDMADSSLGASAVGGDSTKRLPAGLEPALGVRRPTRATAPPKR
jgi:hypothetical protein